MGIVFFVIDIRSGSFNHMKEGYKRVNHEVIHDEQGGRLPLPEHYLLKKIARKSPSMQDKGERSSGN